MNEISKQNNSIDYIELPFVDNAETKRFYSQAFGWEFTDWGPSYISFSGAGIYGGFNGGGDADVTVPGVLVVLYAEDLSKSLEQVTDAGGKIVRPTFEFPGGKRFHFQDPNGNELAVWSEK